jgi:hypothetical protein
MFATRGQPAVEQLLHVQPGCGIANAREVGAQPYRRRDREACDAAGLDGAAALDAPLRAPASIAADAVRDTDDDATPRGSSLGERLGTTKLVTKLRMPLRWTEASRMRCGVGCGAPSDDALLAERSAPNDADSLRVARRPPTPAAPPLSYVGRPTGVRGVFAKGFWRLFIASAWCSASGSSGACGGGGVTVTESGTRGLVSVACSDVIVCGADAVPDMVSKRRPWSPFAAIATCRWSQACCTTVHERQRGLRVETPEAATVCHHTRNNGAGASHGDREAYVWGRLHNHPAQKAERAGMQLCAAYQYCA